jgi:hypothetical protein
MLAQIIEFLQKNIANENWLGIFVVLFSVFFWKAKNIVEFMMGLKSLREKSLLNALKLKEVTGATRLFLEEEINAIIFKKVSGVWAEKTLREKILDIHDRAKGELSLFQFQKARKHLRIRNEKIVITISTFDKAEYILNWSVALIMAVLAFFSFAVIFVAQKILLLQAATLIGTGFLFFVVSLFLIFQTIPYSVAKHIKLMIEELQSSDIKKHS